MKEFRKFPSIDQFNSVIKRIRDNAEYHGEIIPTLVAHGTVKIHGTNSAVCNTGDDYWLQTRERILPDTESHFGFREWFASNHQLIKKFIEHIKRANNATSVDLYGEWAGGNIQKTVGVNGLPKFFTLFSIVVDGVEHQTMHSVKGFDSDIETLISSLRQVNFYTNDYFGEWVVDIDFDRLPELQNYFVELTTNIENKCPVAYELWGKNQDHELIGEGVVWVMNHPRLGILRFKVKGEKHATGSKVKVTAPIDIEKVNNVNEFTSKALEHGRLDQGIMKLREMGLDPTDRKSIGAFVQWVVSDVCKEMIDTIVESGLELDDVKGPVAKKASAFIINYQKEQL